MLTNLSTYLIDKVEPYAKWTTIIILCLAITTLAILFFENKKAFKKVSITLGISFLVYSLILGIVLLSLEISKKYDIAYLKDNWVNLKVINLVFIPLIITLGLMLISFIVIFILKLKNNSKTKLISTICGVICFLSAVVTIVLMAVYHKKYVVGDGYYTDSNHGKLNSPLLYVSALILVVISIGGGFLFSKNDKRPFDAKTIAFAGICISISFALSYIKFGLPQGGSITLVSLLPIMVFSYVYGTKKGVFVGLIYGVLQAVQDPWLLHPAQFLLDYPIAFSMVGFAGIFKNRNFAKKSPQVGFVMGGLVCGILRYTSHVLSGVFAFGAYAADKGKNFLLYSLAYNSFVFVDLAIVLIVGAMVFSSKVFQKTIESRQQEILN